MSHDLSEDDFMHRYAMLAQTTCLNMDYQIARLHEESKQKGTRLDCPTIPRVRKSVTQVYRELGNLYFKRSFRMSYQRFCRLFRLLAPHFNDYIDKNNLKYSPNGKIDPSVRLATGIRFFAGGDSYDIAVLFGMSYVSVFDCVDHTIQAVNDCPALQIEFPADHDAQKEIAAGFRAKSPAAEFDCCVGCIDGILIWSHKPTKEECAKVGVSELKFFCGRKHKYGLNLQAVCDHKKRFLDLSINFGAASSDHMAFLVSHLKEKLSTPGFLADGLCLFGDNAYVNTEYMATPYPNVGSDQKRDAYNFYHSQVRINIECAFGMLTQRWGFLRKQAPQHYTIPKIQAAVSCMARLHNFLISDGETNCPTPSAEDAWTLAVDGAVPFSIRDGVRVPLQLMDVGNHHDDDPSRLRRLRTVSQSIFPREKLSARRVSNGHLLGKDNKIRSNQ